MGKFYIQNFGCRATQADGAALESLLAAKGLESTGERNQADLVILNTCTVTSAADEDVRHAIRRVHRENPLARILVTGCYAQRAPAELAALPGVEWVVGNSHKTQIADLITLEIHKVMKFPTMPPSTSATSSPSGISCRLPWKTPQATARAPT